MVDGISEGLNVDGVKTRAGKQSFHDADLIVAAINSAQIVPQGEKCANYRAWAIYGSVMVETVFDENSIQTTGNKPKVIWAHKKPYILNGDWQGKKNENPNRNRHMR